MIRIIKNLGFFEDHNIKFNYVVDLGAHHGEVSSYCLQKNPQAKILAVEPSSQNFAILQKTMEGFSNVILENKAVSDKKGMVNIRINSVGTVNAIMPGVVPSFDSKLPTEKVQTDTLINLLRKYHFNSVDFMKIDIEGSELLLYEDLETALDFTRCLYVEFYLYASRKHDHHKLLNLFFEKGFCCFDEFKGMELNNLDEAKEYLKNISFHLDVPNLWFLQREHSSQNSCRGETTIQDTDKLSIKNYEEDPGTYLMLLYDTAHHCLMSGRLHEGEKLCQEGLAHNPGNLDILFTLGGIYFKKKRYADAVNAYQRFLEERERAKESPNLDMDTWSYQNIVRHCIGECYRLLGDYEKAIDHLKNAISQDDQHLDLYKTLAFCYIETGELSDGQRVLESAFVAGIADDFVFVQLGDLYIRENRFDEAIKQYEEALEMNPDNSDAYNGWGYALLMKGQKEDADLKFSKALELNPYHERAHFNLMKLKFSQGAHQEALEEIDKLVPLKPESAEVYKDAGDICIKLGKFEKAIELYKECIKKDPADKVTMSNMGSCYAKLGHLESAQMAYQTALSIDTNYSEAARNLRVIDNAIAKLGEEKMADATS